MPLKWLAKNALGILGIGGTMGSTAINARTARRNTDMTNRANRELAEYAYSKDLEMWQRQNEYNTPAAQMARFKEGGLNPHLIYGQGTPGNASQMPQYNAPRMEYNYKPAFDPGNVLMEYQDFRQKNASLDLTKQQVLGQEITNGLRDLEFIPKQLENRIAYAMMWDVQETGIGSRHTYRQDKINDMADAQYNIRTAQSVITQYQSQITKWHAEMSRRGLTPQDGMKWRIAVSILQSLGEYFNIPVNIEDLPKINQ